MDLNDPGMTYVLLIIPSLFAGVVTLQGFIKLFTGQRGGFVIMMLGILFTGLIVGAYYFFIR